MRVSAWSAVCGVFFIARVALALETIVPDPLLQRRIAAVPAAKTAAELDGALTQLKSSQSATLVPQLIYFSMHADDVRAGMTAGVVIDRLPIAKGDLFAAITPYFDSNDPALQRQLRSMLGAVDESPDDTLDFALYASFLSAHRAAPPVTLIAHMLERDPILALRTLTASLIDDPATRAKIDAQAETDASIEQLAQNETWWVRLYVVTRLQQDPALRSAALRERLSRDSHAAVRAAAAALPR